MNVILLTVFVGFLLVNLFVFLYLCYRREAGGSSPERDSLLPLEEEASRPESGSRPDPGRFFPRRNGHPEGFARR